MNIKNRLDCTITQKNCVNNPFIIVFIMHTQMKKKLFCVNNRKYLVKYMYVPTSTTKLHR